ncbi:MAG: cytosolic protein [Desulfotalea sp.]|nr:MAG: cytosolic protein [Desulfotalea sp.]
MFSDSQDANDLSHEENARFIVDLFHRITMHHALWFTEVRHQMGQEKALEMLHDATTKSYGIQMKHLAGLLGFSMVDGVPSPLLEMEPEKLNALKTRMAKNWLVGDGVWFQTVEKEEGMNEAKRCNDSCWAHFSPFEAHSIRNILNLTEHPGLEGLKKALGFRVYACINSQSVVEETVDSFVFQMNKCRVQDARKRKALPDYPCKSAGLVEYSYFARAIDSRIQTTCIGCPPDKHPADWYCAWKFSLNESH